MICIEYYTTLDKARSFANKKQDEGCQASVFIRIQMRTDISIRNPWVSDSIHSKISR